MEETSAVIKCNIKIDRTSTITTIEWFLNGQLLSEAPPNSRRFVTSTSVMIKTLVKKDSGIYGCNHTIIQSFDINKPNKSVVHKYDEFYLKVLNLDENLEPIETTNGHTVVISCINFRWPNLFVKWIRYDIELIDERYLILDNGDLLIREIQFSDAGKYTCIATYNNTIKSIPRILNVKEYTKTEPKVSETFEGTNVTFICTATNNFSLNLDVDWFAEYNIISFYPKSRFIKNNDNSMTIINTYKQDSGLYRCLNKINRETASVKLIVHDKPKAPVLRSIDCDQKYATLAWDYGEPWSDDNILVYVIEYKTSFGFDDWSVALDDIKFGLFEPGFGVVPMVPGATYFFRIFTKYKFGRSDPSISSYCKTKPDIPYKNPENVKAVGTTPTNIVISWMPMPRIEHHAFGFGYQVLWKRDKSDYDWNFEIITNYTISELIINNQPTYQRYKINVIAFNDMGKSNEPPKQVIGYSGTNALIETIEGNDVTIECMVSMGQVYSFVKWAKNYNELTGKRYSTLENNSLQISKARLTDAGEYNCFTINLRNTEIASRPLIVRARTKIITKPQNIKVIVGTSVTFDCSASADQSLHLNIDWLVNERPIDFETEPRFMRVNNFSMKITQTILSDSGNYTCLARTPIDQITINSTLIVQDKPNQPKILEISCYTKNASIKWQPTEDNCAPILYYIIEYNTSFAADIWLTASNNVHVFNPTYYVSLKPWTSYTFRVIAVNKIGKSNPSFHSNVCTTEPDVPYKNPENVKIIGINLTSFIISWTPMSVSDHNGPGFGYQIIWKQDKPEHDWNSTKINNYYTKEQLVIINDQLSYQRYKVKVIAFNQIGKCNKTSKEIIGYLGKDDALIWFIEMLVAAMLFVFIFWVVIILIAKLDDIIKRRKVKHKSNNTFEKHIDPNEPYIHEYLQHHLQRLRNKHQFPESTTEDSEDSATEYLG